MKTKTKTITIQGTEEQVNLFIIDNGLLQLNENKFQIVETRVYALDIQDISIDKGFAELTEEEWMTECERQGRVYTLQGFQRAFNEERVNTNTDLIRFISIQL